MKSKKKKLKGKKDYFVNGEFKLTKKLIDRIPCISSIGYAVYAVDKNGFFNQKLNQKKISLEKN